MVPASPPAAPVSDPAVEAIKDLKISGDQAVTGNGATATSNGYANGDKGEDEDDDKDGEGEDEGGAGGATGGVFSERSVEGDFGRLTMLRTGLADAKKKKKKKKCECACISQSSM